MAAANAQIYNIHKMAKADEPENNKYDSSKYFIETCQDKITTTRRNTKGWIDVIKVLQMTRDVDKSRILLATLESKKRIVVKLSQNLKHEYDISKKLASCKGFIKYICFFECNDDFLNHPDANRKHLCDGPGKSMQIIVMPFFELGSIKSFEWQSVPATKLISCIKQAVLSLVSAFCNKGIVHGDFHAANVLLRKSSHRIISFRFDNKFTIDVDSENMQAVVADFENAKLVNDYDGGMRFAKFDFYQDLQKFFALLPHFVKGLDAISVNDVVLIVSRSFQKELDPILLIDLNSGVGLLDAIGRIGYAT